MLPPDFQKRSFLAKAHIRAKLVARAQNRRKPQLHLSFFLAFFPSTLRCQLLHITDRQACHRPSRWVVCFRAAHRLTFSLQRATRGWAPGLDATVLEAVTFWESAVVTSVLSRLRFGRRDGYTSRTSGRWEAHVIAKARVPREKDPRIASSLQHNNFQLLNLR